VAQRFDVAGVPLGGEFQVTTPVGTAGNGYPSVASDADGNFVVAWTSFYHGGSGTGVFARRYDAAVTPRESTPFRVNLRPPIPDRPDLPGRLRSVGPFAALTSVLSSPSACGATRRGRQIGA
jgi:hypothetical protein